MTARRRGWSVRPRGRPCAAAPALSLAAAGRAARMGRGADGATDRVAASRPPGSACRRCARHDREHDTGNVMICEHCALTCTLSGRAAAARWPPRPPPPPRGRARASSTATNATARPPRAGVDADPRARGQRLDRHQRGQQRDRQRVGDAPHPAVGEHPAWHGQAGELEQRNTRPSATRTASHIVSRRPWTAGRRRRGGERRGHAHRRRWRRAPRPAPVRRRAGRGRWPSRWRRRGSPRRARTGSAPAGASRARNAAGAAASRPTARGIGQRVGAERADQGAEVPEHVHAGAGGPESEAVGAVAVVAEAHRGALVDDQLRGHELARAAHAEQGREPQSIEGVARAQQHRGRGSGQRAAARAEHTDQRVLRRAGEHRQREHAGLQHRRPAAVGDGAERERVGAGGHADAGGVAEHARRERGRQGPGSCVHRGQR